MELDTKHESASNLCEAAQVLKREDPSGTYYLHVCVDKVKCFLTCDCSLHHADAVSCYLRAVEIYTDMVCHLYNNNYVKEL